MDDKMLARIQGDPNYQALVKERSSFGWTLAIITLALYYGFIAIVAFDPGLIAMKVSGVLTVGIFMGAGLIVASVLLTGIYVLRANTRYDDLNRAIVAASTGGAK
ncbi:MAG: DUF485 domain-containing protein [Pseudomonadota bacterium]|nr:DUF485 domain-containing protein [Pseudomonadota bacterium]